VRIEERHLREAVTVHLQAFPGFFLSFLGPRFLTLLYRSFIEDEVGLGFVAVNTTTDQVMGFVVGPLRPEGYFRGILRRKWLAFGIASCPAICRRPANLPRLFRAVFYRGDAPETARDLALLTSIAVAPSTGSRGVGLALLEAFVAEARDRGARGVFLTTDADENERVNAFYRRFGFLLDSCFSTPEGRRMNRYVLIFDALPASHDPVAMCDR
jgi:ribosomal protein S18 acetylase RimI-like enzyme